MKQTDYILKKHICSLCTMAGLSWHFLQPLAGCKIRSLALLITYSFNPTMLKPSHAATQFEARESSKASSTLTFL